MIKLCNLSKFMLCQSYVKVLTKIYTLQFEGNQITPLRTLGPAITKTHVMDWIIFNQSEEAFPSSYFHWFTRVNHCDVSQLWLIHTRVYEPIKFQFKKGFFWLAKIIPSITQVFKIVRLGILGGVEPNENCIQ